MQSVLQLSLVLQSVMLCHHSSVQVVLHLVYSAAVGPVVGAAVGAAICDGVSV